MDKIKVLADLLNIVLNNYDASQRAFNNCAVLQMVSQHFASGRTLKCNFEDTTQHVTPLHLTESQEIFALGQIQTLLIMQHKMEEALNQALNLIYNNGHVISTIHSKLEINKLLHQHFSVQCQQTLFPNYSPESDSGHQQLGLSVEQQLQHSSHSF